MIHSSDVATNKITDLYHASAVENSENKNFKTQNSKKEDNKDNIVARLSEVYCSWDWLTRLQYSDNGEDHHPAY